MSGRALGSSKKPSVSCASQGRKRTRVDLGDAAGDLLTRINSAKGAGRAMGDRKVEWCPAAKTSLKHVHAAGYEAAILNSVTTRVEALEKECQGQAGDIHLTAFHTSRDTGECGDCEPGSVEFEGGTLGVLLHNKDKLLKEWCSTDEVAWHQHLSLG